MNLEQKDNIHLLVYKIRILRKKLISFGYSSKEVNDIILNNFLNIPTTIDWFELQNTTMFYFLKQKLDLSPSDLQIIMCIMSSFESKNKNCVPDYLLEIIDSNSAYFGIDLNNSSSDSNQNESYRIDGMKRYENKKSKIINIKKYLKRKPKPLIQEPIIRKIVHIQELKNLKRQLEQKQAQELQKVQKKVKKE